MMNGIDPAFLFMWVSLIYRVVPGVGGICQFTPWLQFGESCYFGNTKLTRWEDATSFCRQLNDSLAVPDSQAENDFLWGIYLERFAPLSLSYYGPWIGCDDRKEEGKWQCSSNFSNWDKNSPDDYKNAEDCAELSLPLKGQWSDLSCDHNLYSVCEVRACEPEPWASCQVSTGAGLTAARCVFNSAVEASAVSRIILGWRAYRSDGERRSFNLLRFGSGEVVCRLNE